MQHPNFAKLRKASGQPPTFRLLPSTATRDLLNMMPPWFALAVQQAAHRARNMEPARCKHDSTCPQSVWDAATGKCTEPRCG